MQDQERKNFKTAIFFKWFINNKVVTILAIILLFLLNVLVMDKVGFLFAPIIEFLSIIALPTVLAAIFYYLFNPVVDFLEKKRVPRIFSIILLFILAAALIVLGLLVVIPNIAHNVRSFVSATPRYVNEAQNQINGILENPRFQEFRPQVDRFTDSLGNQLIDWSKNFSSIAVSSITSFIGKTTSVIISLIIFPFVLFYLLKDGKKLNGYVTRLLPTDWRKDTSKLLHEINTQLSNYVRGQILVALAVMAMFMIGLPLVGLKYGVALAILAGCCNLIPFLGYYISLAPALIIAFMTGGPFMLVKVIVVFLIEQTIEAHVVSPLILGKSLDIHPITVLFVLLTSVNIFGLWGVLVGIPFYATVKVIVVHIYRWYRERSELYEEERAEESPSEN